LADAALMGLRIKNKADRVIVPEALHPDYRETLQTYLSAQGCEIVTIPQDKATGRLDLGALDKALQAGEPGRAIVVAQSPNYWGVIEPVEQIASMTKGREGLTIAVTTEALSLALLKSPGECGAQIAVGEGQSLGMAPSFGGPLLGLFATRNEYVRQMPGRLCGMTKDSRGNDAFVLTLSTREQHIRRQKATSNICSNQNLCAVAATVHMAAFGKNGLREMAVQNVSLASYLKSQIAGVSGMKLPYTAPSFNEFVVRFPVPVKDICTKALEDHDVILGVPVGDAATTKDILVAVTETKNRDDLDLWVKAAKASLK
jgi:glycine dehydrogenase subunit 1